MECIGIGGGTCSGKSTLARELAAAFGGDVLLIEHDWYYRDQGHLPVEARARQNYDQPDAFDTELLVAHLKSLRAGAPAAAPVYDFATHQRTGKFTRLKPKPIVIVEGILALSVPGLRAEYTFSVFVDTPADIRLIRRLQRDTVERGRSAESVIEQWLRHVRPMHAAYVSPAKRQADFVVPGSDMPDAGAERVLQAFEKKRRKRR